MKYTYNILDEVYYWMLSGKKTIEVRILKEKSKAIKKDDIIIFNNQDQKGKYIEVKVIDKKIYQSPDDLISNNDINKIVPGYTKEELINLLEQIYGKDFNNSKYAAIEFEYLTSDIG